MSKNWSDCKEEADYVIRVKSDVNFWLVKFEVVRFPGKDAKWAIDF